MSSLPRILDGKIPAPSGAAAARFASRLEAERQYLREQLGDIRRMPTAEQRGRALQQLADAGGAALDALLEQLDAEVTKARDAIADESFEVSSAARSTLAEVAAVRAAAAQHRQAVADHARPAAVFGGDGEATGRAYLESAFSGTSRGAEVEQQDPQPVEPVNGRDLLSRAFGGDRG